MTPYPIGMLVFNRLEHTQRTVETLKANHLASESDLYIFSDAAPTDELVASVQAVRNYAKIITGFKSVTLIEHETNKRILQATLDAITFLSAQSSAFIMLEDDITTHPYFLTYMNESLNFYEHTPEVWAVCANSYQDILKRYTKRYDYHKEVIYTQAFYGWGWGSWADKIKLVDFSTHGSEQFLKESCNDLRRHADFSWGQTLAAKTAAQPTSELWDVRLSVSMALNDTWAVFPCINYATTHGFDGSGLHKYDFATHYFDFKLDPELKKCVLSAPAHAPRALHRRVFLGVGFKWVRAFLGNVISIVIKTFSVRE
jgi:hypothetical protein